MATSHRTPRALSHAAWKGLRRLGLYPRYQMERVQRLGLVEVQKGIGDRQGYLVSKLRRPLAVAVDQHIHRAKGRIVLRPTTSAKNCGRRVQASTHPSKNATAYGRSEPISHGRGQSQGIGLKTAASSDKHRRRQKE